MSQETEEKFGKIIHNGRIIDLDSLNEEEREALKIVFIPNKYLTN